MCFATTFLEESFGDVVSIDLGQTQQCLRGESRVCGTSWASAYVFIQSARRQTQSLSFTYHDRGLGSLLVAFRHRDRVGIVIRGRIGVTARVCGMENEKWFKYG
jgi:hypothetical protein